jgi:hypothetical protein
MARKSQWQQFSDNFSAVYGTLNKTFEDFESGKVMRQEFKDEAGGALSGDALDRARYKALADIKTKYGDAAGGLSMRTNYAQLESADFDNELNRATREDQIYQRGRGGSDLLRAQIANQRASAAASARPPKPTNAEVLRDAFKEFFGSETDDVPGSEAPPAPTVLPVPDDPRTPGGGSAMPTVETPIELSGLGSGDGIVMSSKGQPPEETPLPQTGLSTETPPSAAGGAEVETPGRGLGAGLTPPEQPAAQGSEDYSDQLTQTFESGADPAPVVAQRREVNEQNLMLFAQRLIETGEFELAKYVVDGVNTLGTMQTQYAARESARLTQKMEAALRAGGPGEGLRVLDEFNGEGLSVTVVEDGKGGLAVVEFGRDENGDPTNQRVVLRASSEEELQQQLYAFTLDPVAAVQFTTNILANRARKVELELEEAKIPGGSNEERALNWLAIDPDNPNATFFAQVILGMSEEEVADQIARLKIFQGARSQGGGRTPPPAGDVEPPALPTGGAEPPPPPPPEPKEPGSRRDGRKPTPSPPLLEVARGKAADAAALAWRGGVTAGGRRQRGLSPDPESVLETVYTRLRNDPQLRDLEDAELRTLAEEAAGSTSR